MQTAFATDQTFRAQVATHLSHFKRRAASQPDLRQAAVALVIMDSGPGADIPGLASSPEEPALLLTRRAAQLRRHAGQWALPGGRLDDGESHLQAALREVQEEVGLALGEQAVLGFLDDFVTRSGFAMTPIVVWGGTGLHPVADPGEVASLHRIPVREFLREDAPMLDTVETSEHPVLRMPVGDDHIAAPTAAILYQFAQVCLLGKDTRVAHYEQPEFAWK